MEGLSPPPLSLPSFPFLGGCAERAEKESEEGKVVRNGGPCPSLRVLTKTRAWTGGVQGNKLHSGVIRTLRIPERDHVHMTSARRGGGGVQELPNFADR